MAELFRSLATQTQSPEILTTKGFGCLIVSTACTMAELTTESISLWVEKDGRNIDIAKDVLLKDFMLLGTFGEDCIVYSSEFTTIANIDLTEDGGYISLKDNETIKFKLSNLKLNKLYVVNSIEEPVPSTEVIMYERKSMASEDVNRDFDTKGYDLVSLQKSSTINEIALTFDNGTVCKYTPFELECVAKSIDQGMVLTADGKLLSSIDDRLVFPIKGVVNLNIRKTPGTRLDLTMRIDEGDYVLYQMAKA
jgi:hypothetical protein